MKVTKTYPGDEAFQAHVMDADRNAWMHKLRAAFDAGWAAAIAARGQEVVETIEFEYGDKVVEKLWDDPQINHEAMRVAEVRGFPEAGVARLRFPDGSEDSFYIRLLRPATDSEIIRSYSNAHPEEKP